MPHARSGSAAVAVALPDPGRLRSLAVAVLLSLCALLVAGPVQAHAELESSSPKDGATLSTAPAEISFTFGEDLLDTGNAITLTATADDERMTLADPTVSGPVASVPWPNSAPAGEFTAAYRVVSEDGHPVEGSVTFTVTSPTGTSATPSPGAVALSPAPTGLPSAVASAAPSAKASPGGATPESQPEAGVLAWVLGIGVVALIGALAATWVTRRTKSQ